MTELIQFKGAHTGVKLDAVTCDAVARSFLKRIRSHNGYYGCERCEEKSTHQENRMLFLELRAPLHTNERFREKRCKHQNTGESPFLCLDVDIVALFTLDYMDLICLGVMRRLLVIWIGGKYGRGKFSGEQQHTLSGRLQSYR
ncbi:uncharacterized protein LOC135382801 [Ornithodoros turicata]|uniref:uncharacterized protein LOC135382801 n=1 Tax=Ornithodoros turicata TaxID=34597 RepID=UPI003139F9C6